MEKFVVTFELKSFYQDDKYDKVALSTKDYEANTLDDLLEILDDMEEIDQIDEQNVINDDAVEEPEEVNVEYVQIHNAEGLEVDRDEDYEV